jgi:hypothetical protein
MFRENQISELIYLTISASFLGLNIDIQSVMTFTPGSLQ